MTIDLTPQVADVLNLLGVLIMAVGFLGLLFTLGNHFEPPRNNDSR